MEHKTKLITVMETPAFESAAKGTLSEDERTEFVNFIAANPQAGNIIKETGGVRKVRWASKNKGKSGGVRVIYYYHSDDVPVFLLTVYPKKEKDNLSASEKKVLKKLTDKIKKAVK